MEITQGGEYAKIWNPVTNEYNTSLKDQPQSYGIMDRLDLVACGNIPTKDEDIIVKVATTDPNIDTIEIKYTIKKPRIDVSFNPTIIAAGDTANIIFKLKNDDGTLSDLSTDQIFDINLYLGSDYGTLYQPQWDYSSDEIWDVAKGIQFIAAKDMPEDIVSSTVLISQGIGQPSKISINDKKNTKLKSIQNSLIKQKTLLDNIGPLWGAGTITIAKKTSHISASFDKETLSPGDTANIIIKSVDNFGNEADYPDTTHFEIGVKEGCGLGQILDANGNMASFFSSIQKPIRFVVANPLSVDSAVVVLRVGGPKLEAGSQIPSENVTQKNAGSAKNNISKSVSSVKDNGSKKIKRIMDDNYCTNNNYSFENIDFTTATIMKSELTIVFTGPKEIWPYLPKQNNGGYSRGADKPGYNPYTSMKIQLQNGGKPLISQPIKIQIKRTEGTGGHLHTNSLQNELCGKLYSSDIGSNPIILSTDNNGEININKLLSSQISGNYIVQASLVSNNQLKTEAIFEVKVPNLVDFSKIDPQGMWHLTGNTQEHPDNHWCNIDMMKRLLKALQNFYNWSKYYRKSQQGIVLGINDMSLETGGVFDIYGDWNVGNQHSFHRIGYSVDIDKSGMSSNELIKLADIMSLETGIRFPEGPIHFGFLGGN